MSQETDRILNVIAKALADNFNAEMKKANERQYPRSQMPGNAKAFPGKKVGDFLFACHAELGDGAALHVVLFVNEDGFVRVIREGENFDPENQVCWGCDWMFETEEEALRDLALKDKEYGEELIYIANRVLKGERV